jgi:hypothetical protein
MVLNIGCNGIKRYDMVRTQIYLTEKQIEDGEKI